LKVPYGRRLDDVHELDDLKAWITTFA